MSNSSAFKILSITEKLLDDKKKEREKKIKATLPFFITAQKQVSSVKKQKRLYEISDSMGKHDIRCKV